MCEADAAAAHTALCHTLAGYQHHPDNLLTSSLVQSGSWIDWNAAFSEDMLSSVLFFLSKCQLLTKYFPDPYRLLHSANDAPQRIKTGNHMLWGHEYDLISGSALEGKLHCRPLAS